MPRTPGVTAAAAASSASFSPDGRPASPRIPSSRSRSSWRSSLVSAPACSATWPPAPSAVPPAVVSAAEDTLAAAESVGDHLAELLAAAAEDPDAVAELPPLLRARAFLAVAQASTSLFAGRGSRLPVSLGIVLNFVNEQNRPLNSQNAADSLQKFNLKKTAVQKALDALADSGQISFKEYGKQKIYIARQDQFNIPNGEELEEMKKANNKLQEELTDQKKAISEVESEVRGLQSNITLAEIKSKEAKLRSEVQEMEEKLNKLRNGVILVKPEDRKITEESFSEKVKLWRKRKRMFKELWDNITENSPKDQKEFKEELGFEYDEDVSVNLQSYSDMLMSLNKRRKISR